MDIRLSSTNTYDHVPESEQNNRTIKEIVWSIYHRFPYNNIPKVIIIELVLDKIINVNVFPLKGIVSEYYSLLMSVCGSGLQDPKDYSLLGGGVPVPEHRLSRSLDSVPIFRLP